MLDLDAAIIPFGSADKYLLTMIYSWMKTPSESDPNIPMAIGDTATFEAFIRKNKRDKMIVCGSRRIYQEWYQYYLGMQNSGNKGRAYIDILFGLMCEFNIGNNEEQYDQLQDVAEQILAAFFDPRNSISFAKEGDFVYENVPFFQATGNLVFTQIIETYILSCLNHGIGVASKAYELRNAAPNLMITEGGARRTDPNAAYWAAYASNIGMHGKLFATSHMGAAYDFGIPCKGTMAHSFVSSFKTEFQAFEAYMNAHGEENTILLVDTYDVYHCIDSIAEEIRNQSPIGKRFEKVMGIRLDSGNIIEQIFHAKQCLPPNIKIFASNGFNTDTLREFTAKNIPIDGVIVGEQLTQYADSPVTGAVYKLVEINGVGKAKKAEGKVSYPFGKAISFRVDHEGTLHVDMRKKDNVMCEYLVPVKNKRLRILDNTSWQYMFTEDPIFKFDKVQVNFVEPA
jgi:putative nicotinate phosphoribosyltransferase